MYVPPLAAAKSQSAAAAVVVAFVKLVSDRTTVELTRTSQVHAAVCSKTALVMINSDACSRAVGVSLGGMMATGATDRMRDPICED
jgi:hypothetical protein